jgi:Ca-activated chloride channel family protein
MTMLKYLGVQQLRFGEPLYLWLLAGPALLLVLWCWRVIRRRADGRAYQAVRLVPVRERFAAIGDLAFWLCAILALSLTIVAIARPQGITSIVRSPGADIVLLMDGSASMRVIDMGTDRWQRAMVWVRTLTQTLAWDGDRLALATFADIAVPQIRLTRDPNTILFFLDHLDKQPTFKLEDDTTWDTNAEDAIRWGMKLVDTDQEMYGPSKNAKTMVIVSDGQVWSGDVQRAIAQAVNKGFIVDVIGAGTSTGGMIPLPHGDNGKVLAGFIPIRSSIDRISLMSMAREGNGEYFELGTASDEQIAARIIQTAARRSGNEQLDQSFDELYWYVLVAAAVFLGLGMLFLKQRVQLGLAVASALALIALIASLRH